MQTEIKHKWSYDHSPEIVWDYLTKAELVEQWLMKNDFLPVVGHEFQFRTNPMPNFNFNGIINCRVLEIIPFKKLSYSWKGGGNDGSITLDSVVLWTLEPKDGGTELSLLHTGFKEGDFVIYPAMNEGWFKNMKKIEELIKTADNGNTNT